MRRRMATPEAIRTAPTKAKMLASSPVRGSLPFDPEELAGPLWPFEEVDAVVAVGDDPLPLVLLPLVPPEDVPCVPDPLLEPPPWWPPPLWFENGS